MSAANLIQQYGLVYLWMPNQELYAQTPPSADEVTTFYFLKLFCSCLFVISVLSLFSN
jgi:hypothetical protein